MFLHSSEHFSPNKRTTLHKNGGALSPEWAILLNRLRVSQFQRAAPPNPLCVIITVAALIRELSPERRFAARNAVASTRLKTRARFRVGCALARAKSWHRRRRAAVTATAFLSPSVFSSLPSSVSFLSFERGGSWSVFSTVIEDISWIRYVLRGSLKLNQLYGVTSAQCLTLE